MNRPADAAVRRRALDPDTSFIVQAPAGSGKTELLTQRYLRLLAGVDQPEEVLAITFTRKAANEMRQRVMLRLRQAGLDPEALGQLPPHEQQGVEWARAVLRRSDTLEWQLSDNPQRLNISTIDTLNARLVRQMPYLSRLGGNLGLVEDAEPLYREAARRTVGLIQQPVTDSGQAAEDHLLSEALSAAVTALDGGAAKLETMLVAMLARRDQWLRHTARVDAEATGTQDPGNSLGEQLDHAVRRVAADLQGQLASALDRDTREALTDLARFAAGNVVSEHHPVHRVATLDAAADWDIGQWRALAQWLLTANGGWRRRFNINDGFPPQSQGAAAVQAKAQITALTADLTSRDELLALLDLVRSSPPLPLAGAQRQLVINLVRILRRATRELLGLFSERSEMDFIGLGERALTALGDDELPSDLALRLDYGLRHILMDEFQDTSITQFRLLQKLVAGWDGSDGRSLFLVGDPMQSIYRFREAEVGLFSQVWQRGRVGSVILESLRLSVNFRSRPVLVAWVNQAFRSIFPAQDDPHIGAVSHAPSSAGRQPGHSPPDARAERPPALHLQYLPLAPDHQPEADWIVNQVSTLLQRADTARDTRIAILVRSRGHGAGTVQALRRAAIPFQAVDLDPLAGRQVVQDLLMITRALYHPADRIAWLALLRGPWCGLTMAELDQLLGADPKGIVWEQLRGLDAGDIPPASRAHIERFVQVMEAAQAQYGRRSLALLVEWCWLSLGGLNASVIAGGVEGAGHNTAAQDDARAYLRLLAELEGADDGASRDLLERVDAGLERLYAAPAADPAASRVQVMTIHKAKGLEFDHVLVPGLHRIPRRRDKPLLEWQEMNDDAGGILVAPYEASPQHTSSGADTGLYDYLYRLEQEKADHEARRLLYVALTRARETLHLPLCVRLTDDGEPKAPAAQSLLNLLWPLVADQQVSGMPVDAALSPSSSQSMDNPVPQPTARLPQPAAHWDLPAWWFPAAPNEASSEPEQPLPERLLDLGDLPAQAVGTVLHEVLEYWHNHGVPQTLGEALRGGVSQRIRQFGVAAAAVDELTGSVMEGLAWVLATAEARNWLQRSDRMDSWAELGLLETDGYSVREHRLDRVYRDQTGLTILDYKFSARDAAQTASRPTGWQDQLQRYQDLWKRLEPDTPVTADIALIRRQSAGD